MNGADWFDGAGDWTPPTLDEQLHRRLCRLEGMVSTSRNTLLAIRTDLDGIEDMPTCGSLTKAKVKEVRLAYQRLNGWALEAVDVTARVWALAEDAQQELTPPAVEIEKRRAGRFSQSQVSLERIRLCKG